MSPVSIQAAVYAKLEASFTIASLATDPFDYAATDVRALILQPDGTSVSLPAFFDGATTWRVRHTPSSAGVYQVTGVSLNGAPLITGNLQPSSWEVSGTPIGPGYVRLDPANTNRFITSDGRRYFPAGQNLAWDTSSTLTVAGTMAKLGASRENWARVWMDHWDGKNLDWPASGASGQLNLGVAQKWDGIVTAAEQAGVFFQMTLQHHGQYSSTVDANWPQNPYNIANGGFLTNAAQFFTNTTAKSLTKRKLRYALARWGYSPAIMAWELFNEVQFTDAGQNGQWPIVAAWHDEMAQFVRSQDPYHHLITTSSDLNQPIWNQCDYYQHHDYPTDLISALRDSAGVPAGQPVKPIFGGESGSDAAIYYGLAAPLWSGLMGAQSGAAQPWYWDRIEAEGGYPLLRSLRNFVLSAGIAEQNELKKSAPRVTSPVGSNLAFAPGGGWASASQTTFTVADSAPDGSGTLPSFLQGAFHRVGMNMPNGYTFLVNYSQAGTFSAQVLTIAASGASLVISVDNNTTNRIDWPASGADISTNYTLSINVPAGQHTVRLTNPGSDWVNLGNLTLSPYVSILGGYQIGNTNFAALWIWHRTNIYNPGATVPVSGSFALGGLQPGAFAATWWDTFTGTAISNFTLTVAGTNPVTIPTPPILRSVALYAGPAAQASIGTPVLTQTLGTNSPTLTLPLSITNRGGLPLAYSLSVTGYNSIAYTAATSTQAGGPGFAWKDFSAVGRDITASFTALTAKPAQDEGIAGPIDIGFPFPFFSGGQTPGVFTQLYVSPNGFVTFSPFSGDTSVNRPVPGALAPTNLIAFFWRDLDLSAGGRVYTDGDPRLGIFTLQFQNVRFKSSAATVTCQLVLKTTGEILMQYKSMTISNTCTVGVQNATGSQGSQMAFNQNYLNSNFCLRLNPASWLGLDASAGLTPIASADTVNISLNPAGLAYGTYSAMLSLTTGDGALPYLSLPITLEVSALATWRQTHFGVANDFGDAADTADPDHDGLINIFEYAFNTDPNVVNAQPISYGLTGGHLTITFKRTHPAPPDITYLIELTDNLLSEPWQSGPAFTTQSITDNLNGTETVVVTENATASSSQAHFARVRVSRP